MELMFLANKYKDIPKEKLYLLNYFYLPKTKMFLIYYLTHGSQQHFVAHTGYRCTSRWCYKLVKRLDEVVKAHEKAKKSLDFDALLMIESGKYEFHDNNLKYIKKRL